MRVTKAILEAENKRLQEENQKLREHLEFLKDKVQFFETFSTASQLNVGFITVQRLAEAVSDAYRSMPTIERISKA